MDKPPFSLRLYAFFLLSIFMSFPAAAGAQEFSLTSDTLMRGFERNTDGSDDLVLPVYEYLRLDAGDPESHPLTFHLYGWGRADLASSDFYRDDTAGELLYGYLEYTRPQTNFFARLGRQYVFEGVSNEAVDGLRVGGDISQWFNASAYAGYPVGLDSEQGRSGDFIYGGRFAHHLRNLYEVGLSYKSIDNDSNLADQRLGVDLSLFLPGGVNVYGVSTRNLETEDWAEHSYELDANMGPLRLRPFFEYYRFEDYFSAGAKTAGPFRFLANSGEKLTVFGADALLQKVTGWELGAKYKHYDYDVRDETSDYYSALAVWHGEDSLTQAGGELGRMDGDSDETCYLLGRAYFYYDQVPVSYLNFVTGDLVYVLYDEDVYGEDTSLFLSLGAGKRFLDDRLELKVSGDYSFDPYYDDDLRGLLMAKFTYGR